MDRLHHLYFGNFFTCKLHVCLYSTVGWLLDFKVAATLSWSNFNGTIFARSKYHSLTSS